MLFARHRSILKAFQTTIYNELHNGNRSPSSGVQHVRSLQCKAYRHVAGTVMYVQIALQYNNVNLLLIKEKHKVKHFSVV